MALLHKDYTFVRHAQDKVLNRDEWEQVILTMWGKVEILNSRCLYENSDILVVHNIISFGDSSKEAVMIVYEKKDGLLFKCETGATLLTD
mgnify:FL=1